MGLLYIKLLLYYVDYQVVVSIKVNGFVDIDKRFRRCLHAK